jgi:hypothetical protein
MDDDMSFLINWRPGAYSVDLSGVILSQMMLDGV